MDKVLVFANSRLQIERCRNSPYKLKIGSPETAFLVNYRALLDPMRKRESNLDPALEFCRLCREGRLFEAEAWLKAGKPARYEHKNVRCTPLGIAIDRGFHSLVEVLLKNGLTPTPKHLALAVRKGHAGIVDLLFEHGAEVNWLSFHHVTYWPRPEILKMFIEHGADTHTGYPIAQVLKRAPRAFLGIYKTYRDRFPDWQFQANMALRHLCREGAMQGVCLLLWANADPRDKVPMEGKEDEDLWDTSLNEACLAGHYEIVKKIGPSRDKDDLDELLRLACFGEGKNLLQYLVERGANPNAVPATGETALRQALWAVEWRLDFDRHEPSYQRHRTALEKLKRLVELGARLNPGVKEELRFLRRLLVKLDWSECYDFIKFLWEHAFADSKILVGLIKEPKMRRHLEKRMQALARIFPELKKWAEC